MGIGSVTTIVAPETFIIAANQQRVWRMLGGAIFQSLPLEQMNVVNQTTFYAILRWRLGFIDIPLDIKGKMVDVIDLHSLSSVIRVQKGIMNLGLKVTFILKPLGDNETEITCSAVEEEKRSVIGWIIARWERDFAEKIINSIGVRLQNSF